VYLGELTASASRWIAAKNSGCDRCPLVRLTLETESVRWRGADARVLSS
jgi:hypothetical protein